MAYTAVGEGPISIVVLPGLDDGLYTVDSAPTVLALLSAKRAQYQRLLFLSRRQPMPFGYSVEQHAEDMLWAIEQMQWGPATLECNSAGGPVGQWMAIKRPDVVRGLILSSTMHYTDDHTRNIIKYWISLVQQAKWGAFRWSVISCTFNKRLWLLRPFRPFLPLMGSPRYPERVERILSPLMYLDNSEIVSRITCPTLVIGGEDDRVINAGVQREMAAALPNSRLKLYPGYGHGNDRENPDYPKEVARFLQSEMILRREDK
jgi:pimeloyl-ACP methyl ester carboxylesterase